MLLHGLEQGTLDLGWSSVDLVGEDEVGEDRPLLHLEVLVLLAVHHRPDDVGGQQVGGELDTLVVGLYQLRQRLDRERLGKARQPLKEDMPTRKQADEERVYEVFLPDDRLTHARAEGIDDVALTLNLGREHAYVY